MDINFKTPLLDQNQADSFFYITPQELAQLFVVRNIKDGKSLQKLKQLGGTQGVSQKLRADYIKGLDINNNSEETVKRKCHFGTNVQQQQSQKSIFHFIYLKLQDQVLRWLFILSIIQLIFSKIWDENQILENCSVLVIIIIVILYGARNDRIKDNLFRILEQKGQKKNATVIRQGRTHIIDVQEILVGDLVEVKSGEKVPVDGILVNSYSKLIIENALSNEYDRPKFAEPQQNMIYDPFLLSGSQIIQGTGLMLATCVGDYSFQYLSTIKSKEEICSTPLQEKLEKIAESFALPALFLSILIVVGFFV